MPPPKPRPSPTSVTIPPLHIRLDARGLAALIRAHRATGGAVSTHRVALAALTIGARIIGERPAVLFELFTEGEDPGPTSAPAPPPSIPPPPPAPERPAAAPPVAAPKPHRPKRPPPPTAPTGAREAADDVAPIGEKGSSRPKATDTEVEAASVAIRRARAADHGTAALLRAAGVANTGGARETLRDLAADPRPARTFTRALVLSLTAGALLLSPSPTASSSGATS